MKTIYNLDCLDLLETRKQFDCIIADPPDNLGLGYDGYSDKVPQGLYYDFIARRLEAMTDCTNVIWLSYYWKHDIEIKYIVRNLLKFRKPSWEAKTFIWRFTFGQHNEHDAGSGFRFILRLRKSFVAWSPPSRVRSIRQEMGDPRANPDGRVPDDVWEVPRVTGNSAERRAWHPTQHPVGVYEKMLDGSRVADRLPEKVLDCFGGTGTLFRLGLFGDSIVIPREATICEISEEYVAAILKEHPTARLLEL
jgi:DNA modification methylase